MPQRTAATLVNRLFSYADERPVSCSNLGDLPPALGLVDGAPCRRLLARAVDVNVTRRDLDRSHGHLVVVASRFSETMCLAIEAWQHDAANTAESLRAVARTVLEEFELQGEIEA
jgi:hypothetical protein